MPLATLVSQTLASTVCVCGAVGEYFAATDSVVPWHQMIATWLYAVTTQVLLMNLLIAMMNDTYHSAHLEGEVENNLNFAMSTSPSRWAE